MRGATQPSATPWEGPPHGQLQGKTSVSTPGVDPHSGLINCSGLLPGLVTRLNLWGLEFSENRFGFLFSTAWLTPTPGLLFGGQAERRLEEGRKCRKG